MNRVLFRSVSIASRVAKCYSLPALLLGGLVAASASLAISGGTTPPGKVIYKSPNPARVPALTNVNPAPSGVSTAGLSPSGAAPSLGSGPAAAAAAGITWPALESPQSGWVVGAPDGEPGQSPFSAELTVSNQQGVGTRYWIDDDPNPTDWQTDTTNLFTYWRPIGAQNIQTAITGALSRRRWYWTAQNCLSAASGGSNCSNVHPSVQYFDIMYSPLAGTPNGDQILRSQSVTFSFAAADPGRTHIVRAKLNGATDFGWVIPSGGTSTTQTLPEGDWVWWGQSCVNTNGTNCTGVSSASPGYFTVQVAPTIPAPSAPQEGSSVRTLTPTLVAAPGDVGSNTRFQFQLADDSGFTQNLTTSPNWSFAGSFAVPLGRLDNKRTYYWRVRIQDDVSTSAWSGPRSFTTDLQFFGTDEAWPMWSQGAVSANLAMGNLVMSVPGPSYPTAAGVMSLGAVHNSLAPNASVGQGSRTSAGLIGSKFQLVTDAGEIVVPAKIIDHAEIGDGNFLEVAWGDGSWEEFLPAGSGGVTGPPGSYRPSDGSASATVTKHGSSGYTLLSSDGTLFTFAVAVTAPGPDLGSGRITSYQTAEPSGANLGALQYTFDTTQSPAKLTRILDGAGRAVDVTWNALNSTGCANAIVCIKGPDNVVWRYVGDQAGGTAGELSRINNGTRDILGLSWTGPQITGIQDANDLDPTNTTISPGYNAAHSTALTYDASGRLSSVTEGPVTGQVGESHSASPTNSTWTFSYAPGSVATAATRATHGSLASGTVRTAAGVTTVTPPRQLGAATPKTARYFYDTQGRELQMRDVAGRVTMSGYNPDDTEAWTEDALGYPTDNEYDQLERVLLRSTGPDPDGAGSLARPVTETRYDEKTAGTAATPGSLLTGLRAEYYSNPGLSGRPYAIQIDPNVDYVWGDGGPPGISDPFNLFSVRWSGEIYVASAGTYVFAAEVDDGFLLSLDDALVLNRWQPQAGGFESLPVTLTAGWHRIRADYYENTGNSTVRLRWRPSTSPAGSETLIPTGILRPAYMNATSTITPSGRYSYTHYKQPWTAKPEYDLRRSGSDTIVTSYEYDAFGRIVRKVMPRGNVGRTIDAATGDLGTGGDQTKYATAWSYYNLSPVESASSSTCGVASTNQGGLLKSKAVWGLATQTSVYDSAGREVAFTEGRGTTCRVFTSEGRMTSERTRAGQAGLESTKTYTYDPAGDTRTVTKTGAGTVATEYDEAGRVKRTLDSQDTAPPAPPGTAPADASAPTVGLISPAAGGVSGSAVSVAATVTDDVGVVGVQFKLDGANLGPEDTRAPFRVMWDAAQAANGAHSITAVARDASGKATTSAAVAVTVTGGGGAPPPGLKAAYNFNEGTGTTVTDRSANGNTATLSGATWTTLGKYAGGIDLNGTTHYLSAPGTTTLDITGAVTVEIWAKRTKNNAYQVLVGKPGDGQSRNENYALWFDSSNRPTAYFGNGTTFVSVASAALDNNWHHIAATYDNATARLYIDGVQTATNTSTVALTPRAGALNLGRDAGGSYFFGGTLDDLRVYSRVLTAAEVTSDMNTSVTSATPATVGTIPPGDGATEAHFVYDQEGNQRTRHAAPGAISAGQAHTVNQAFNADNTQSTLEARAYGSATAGDTYGFSYDTRGSPKGIQYPGNVAYSWRTYNQAGWLTGLYNRHGAMPSGTLAPGTPPAADSSPIADYEYDQYDIDGRKLREILRFDAAGTQTRTYTYDSIGRLSTYRTPGNLVREYRYDTDSNRTQVLETPNGGSQATIATYTYDPGTTPAPRGVDQLTSRVEGGQTTTYTYNIDGDLATEVRGTTTIRDMSTAADWNGDGLLTSGAFGATRVQSTLDPIGNQKVRGSTGGNLEYLTSDNLPLFERVGGKVTLTSLDGPDGPLAQYSGALPAGLKTFSFFNGHGDNAAISNSAGVRQGAVNGYAPFGEGEGQSVAANTTTERYTGKWHKRLDTQSALIGMGVRPYDPALGRFIAGDPVEGGSLNQYEYTGQDPVNVYDLSGKARIVDWACVTRIKSQYPGGKYVTTPFGRRWVPNYQVDRFSGLPAACVRYYSDEAAKRRCRKGASYGGRFGIVFLGPLGGGAGYVIGCAVGGMGG